MTMPPQHGSWGNKLSQKRRIPHGKLSSPLLLSNTSRVHLVHKHSSNSPGQRLLQPEQLILINHFHVLLRKVPGRSSRGRDAWDAFVSRSSCCTSLSKAMDKLHFLSWHFSQLLSSPLLENGIHTYHLFPEQLQGESDSIIGVWGLNQITWGSAWLW